jgi:hypothetical protein
MVREGPILMLSDSQQRFRMDRLLWCLCADYIAERPRVDLAFVQSGAFAARGAVHRREVVRAAWILSDGKPEPFERLARSIVLGLCPLGNEESKREKRVKELHDRLERRLNAAAMIAPTRHVPDPAEPDKLDWEMYQNDAKCRFEKLSGEMSQAFHAWAEKNPDPEKWGDDMDDLVADLAAIWRRDSG